MRPHLRARIAGSTACVHRNADFRLTAMVRSKSSSVRSSTPRTIAMPALLTRISIGPSARGDLPDHFGNGRGLRDIGRDRDGATAVRLMFRDDSLRFPCPFAIIDRDRGAGLGQSQCDRRTNAARRPRHQRDMRAQILSVCHRNLT